MTQTCGKTEGGKYRQSNIAVGTWLLRYLEHWALWYEQPLPLVWRPRQYSLELDFISNSYFYEFQRRSWRNDDCKRLKTSKVRPSPRHPVDSVTHKVPQRLHINHGHLKPIRYATLRNSLCVISQNTSRYISWLNNIEYYSFFLSSIFVITNTPREIERNIFLIRSQEWIASVIYEKLQFNDTLMHLRCSTKDNIEKKKKISGNPYISMIMRVG